MTDPAKHTKARILIILGMVLLLPLAIGMQMIRIQLFEGNALRALWNAQALDVIPVPAQRGQILDARGRIMVSNTVTYSLAIDPLVPNTQPSHIAEILDTLSAYTGPARCYVSLTDPTGSPADHATSCWNAAFPAPPTLPLKKPAIPQYHSGGRLPQTLQFTSRWLPTFWVM